MKTPNRRLASLSFLRWCAAVATMIITGNTARAQWQLVDTGAVQNSVTFAKNSPNVAWTVGDSGYIRRSLDGGATWTSQPSGTSNTLNGITTVDGVNLWTVGQGGTILKTTSSGNLWTAQTSGVGTALNSVAAADNNVVWAVGLGGAIRKTVNGGTNWTGQTSGTTQPLNSVYVVDTNVAWAVGNNGVILKTVNGGANWVAQSSGVTSALQGITAADANTAWLVGDSGLILKTTNGGTNWTAQTSNTIQALQDITAVNANVVWAVGNNGTILKTVNGGTTWQVTASGTTRQLFSVSALDDQTSLSVGFFGTCRLTNDGGTSYIGQITGTSQPLRGITSAGEQSLWTVGFSGTARTTANGGNIWTVQTTPNSRNYYAVTRAGINTLWAVGTNGTIIKSVDGGANWLAQTSGTTTQLNDVTSVDVNTAWTVGEGGLILNTVNGTTWASQTSNTSSHLNGVSALNSSLAYAVGNAGTIVKWNGASWQVLTSGVSSKLNSVTVVDANKAWVVGDSGLILVTTNGGTNWTSQSSGTTQHLNSVSAWDGSNAWAVGENGTITHTSNGVNWFPEGSPTQTSWYSVRAVAADKAFASGNNGSVIRNFTPLYPPIAVTRAASNISGTTARLNATITPNGAPTVAEIEYGIGASGPFTHTATLTLTPNDGPVGQTVFVNVNGLSPRSPYHFRAKATNIAGSVEGATLTFNTGNTTPVATLSTASTNEDTALPLTLTANDPDGDTLTYVITEGPAPAAGTLSAISGGNQVTFTPAQDYHGPATFKYTASDAFGGTSTEQTVTITVISINDLPTISANQSHIEGVLNEAMNNTGNWGDVDGDNVQLSANIGSVIKNGDGTWSWSYTGNAASVNTSVTITANDQNGGIATVNFTFTVNTPPNIAVTMFGNPVADNAAGEPIGLGIAPIGGSIVRTVTVSNSGTGTLSITNVTATNSPIFSATDTFGNPLSYPFNVAPGATSSFGIRFAPTASAPIVSEINIISNVPGSLSPYTFNVGGVGNRPPVVGDDVLTLVSLTPTVATDLLLNDNDPDGGPLTIISHTNGGSGSVSVNGGGHLVYTPGPTYIGYDVFTYTVQDQDGASTTGTVIVNGAVVPPPVGPGNYAALLRDGEGEVQGMVTYKFNAAGGTSGQLRIGRVTRRFSGPAVGGEGVFQARAKNNPTYPVTVSLGTTAMGGYAALDFTVNAGVLGTLTGQSTKSPFAKNSPPLQAGRFTVLAVNDTVTPAVGATLFFRVGADGLISWTGKNGTGHNITGSSVLMTAGVAPIYAGRTGAGANVMHSELIFTVPRVYGSIRWNFTGPDVRVPSAFSHDYPVLGESYALPANASALLGTGQVTLNLNVPRFDTDNLPATVNPLNLNFTLAANSAPDQLPVTKVRFDLARGFFTGKVNVAGYAPRAFYGVILRQSVYGRGVIMDVSAIGSVRLTPAP